jgi:hypothetical protein
MVFSHVFASDCGGWPSCSLARVKRHPELPLLRHEELPPTPDSWSRLNNDVLGQLSVLQDKDQFHSGAMLGSEPF